MPLLFVSLFLISTLRVSAQEINNPADSARFRVGALRFTPSIAVSNLGVDNNVFNEADDPLRDTTAAVGPAVALWMKLGRARLSGNATGQYLYFKRYVGLRSWNTRNDARLDFPLAHLKPFMVGAYINARERPGFEIDSRARRRDGAASIGTDLRLSGKTTIVASGSYLRLQYDRAETFLGATLADALDRRSTGELLQLRYAVTPLTTLVVSTDAVQHRFDVDKARHADSVRATGGFEFKPFALISGRAAVGFRHFKLLSQEAPDFNGLVASVDAAYSRAATRLQAKLERDLEFSYQQVEPYYALTDFILVTTQRLTRVWDAVIRAGHQSLAYRRVRAAVDAPQRVDHGAIYGAGIGYRLGNTVRLGVDANYYSRQSDAFDVRNFEGLRIGAAVSYGLPQ